MPPRCYAWLRYGDPYEGKSDDEFDAHVNALFSKHSPTVGVSLRVAPELLERVKRESSRVGMPYQTFMKSIVEAAITRMERRDLPARKTKAAARVTGTRPRTKS